MELSDLCRNLARMRDWDSAKKALCLLWWFEEKDPNTPVRAGALARVLRQYALGNPNSSALSTNLAKTRLCLKVDGGFRLKAMAKPDVGTWVRNAVDIPAAEVNLETGFLPADLWRGTRGYIEKVCVQLNGCYQYGFYDAASVMCRRLIETLIIECYEHLNREGEIRDGSGNYLMLGDLVDKVLSPSGLSVGRESKTGLTQLKKLGDRCAHNRRYNAVKADLDRAFDLTRVVVDELVNMAPAA